MHKTNYNLPGTAPATLIVPQSEYQGPPVIRAIEYDENSFNERVVSNIAEVLPCRDNGRISWINVDGLTEIETVRSLGEHFGLHPLALEDALSLEQRPKVEHFSDHLFVVAQMIYLDENHEVTVEQISMFVGKNFVLSFQEEPGLDVFEGLRDRIRHARPNIRKNGSDYLAYSMLDCIVDQHFPILERLGDAIEELEDQIFKDHRRNDVLEHIYTYKRALIECRRTSWPLREVVGHLVRSPSPLFDQSTTVYLRDCYDHIVEVIDIIENYRELISGLTDTHLSFLSQRTNEVMRVLTVISAIFIPLTFIAGVYGMNFDPDAGPLSMPELRTPYGYIICIGFMLATAVGMLGYFKRKGWL